MIWSRLKSMKCPDCNSEIVEHAYHYSCKKKTCDFTVSKEKFNAIIKKLYIQKHSNEPQYGDNDEALNNERW